LWVNKLVAQAELLVAEGFIEPHFFAGFSGGRKAVLPGVVSRRTVMYNHNSTFIDNDNCAAGVLEGNPIHQDMLFAAHRAGLAFIVNVVLDQNKNIVFACAGEPVAAHAAGVSFLNKHCRVQKTLSDIVITTNGGYPLDQNIYQAVKGMAAGARCVKQGGTVIMVAQSGDGHGGEQFLCDFANDLSLDTILTRFRATPPEDTPQDQWQSQIFANVLKKASVIFVSDAPDDMVRALRMTPAHTIEEALALAGEGSVTIMPDGIGVIVV
ncbi:MAG: nickel-dependent lactate racemase, partial [Clostridia bacterium]|nr:nickel-dependent lactate racemase [Clostridia bacterium]